MQTLLLTLHLDQASQSHFEDLRRLHFPPERNQVPAHISLFHSLPETGETLATLQQAAHIHPAFPIEVTGLRSLGRGVAYTLAAPALSKLHRELSTTFAEHLIPQDRQPFHPHIVVQNKATPGAARSLLAVLQSTFSPMTIHAEGLDLWRYLNGPWRFLETYPFRG